MTLRYQRECLPHACWACTRACARYAKRKQPHAKHGQHAERTCFRWKTYHTLFVGRAGYSRDHRPDCKQVCIGLVVTKCGMPLGYEVFAGNRVDVTTLQEIVQTMERRYGRADRIWVGDRGMVSADNIAFLKQSGDVTSWARPRACSSNSSGNCSLKTGT